MTFTLALPEQKPWLAMDDQERRAYFEHCEAHQPIDTDAFREAIKAKREAGRNAETASKPAEIAHIAEQGGEHQKAVAGRIGVPISPEMAEPR